MNQDRGPLALIIIDGWGHSPTIEGNAIALATTPYYDELRENYQLTLLEAHGTRVGLPAGRNQSEERRRETLTVFHEEEREYEGQEKAGDQLAHERGAADGEAAGMRLDRLAEVVEVLLDVAALQMKRTSNQPVLHTVDAAVRRAP